MSHAEDNEKEFFNNCNPYTTHHTVKKPIQPTRHAGQFSEPARRCGGSMEAVSAGRIHPWSGWFGSTLETSASTISLVDNLSIYVDIQMY